MATIRGNSKKNTLNGTSGRDSIFGLGGNDILKGKNGNDKLFGGSGNDQLFGGNGNDQLFGGGGNDRFFADKGADRINGGSGNDIVNYEASTVGISINGAGAGTGGLAQGDTLTGVETIIGSEFNDEIVASNVSGVTTVFGRDGTDTLVSVDGAHTLHGGAGNDVLLGFTAPDILTGGDGADLFRYISFADTGTGLGNRDIITDFNSAQGDRILITEITAGGALFTDAVSFADVDGFKVATIQYSQLVGVILVPIFSHQIAFTLGTNVSAGDFIG